MCNLTVEQDNELRKLYLVQELATKNELVKELERNVSEYKEIWTNSNIDGVIKNEINLYLNQSITSHQQAISYRIHKKLTNLILNTNNDQSIDKFINLSQFTPTENQRKFLNLGLNCHYINKPNKIDKTIEIEKLMSSIIEAERKDKVIINPAIAVELQAECKKQRGYFKSKLLTDDLKIAAKEIKENNNIIIRRADKSSQYVIIDKADYHNKLDDILNDSTKFKEIKKDPTSDLKTKLNKIIRQIIKNNNEEQLFILTGEYSPGYLYGNIKTHKANNPIRPIISQTPTVTYPIAKYLNRILTPYIPNQYNLKSSKEFIDIINTNIPSNHIASLDVESLFTNVPISDTINIILNTVYHSEMTPLKIPKSLLKSLLLTCTTEAPFYSPTGKLYKQVDGIAMGSPLGVLFADFYVGHLEEQTFKNHPLLKPHIYARYVDDIFVAYDNPDQVDKLLATLNKSKIKFTIEKEKDLKLPFLDVLVTRNEHSYTTAVYVKETNKGICLNGKSECTTQYKISTAKSFVNRAFTHSSTLENRNTELKRITRLLVNNNYDTALIEDVINKKLQHTINPPNKNDPTNNIIFYYRNHMTPAYKVDESILNRIIHKNITPKNVSDKIYLRIYYNNAKTSNLILKNNCIPNSNSILKRHHLIYEFKCPFDACTRLNSSYIGVTTTSLSRRLTMHKREGAIKSHLETTHNTTITREILDNNTSIIYSNTNHVHLHIAEGVLIDLRQPSINKQQRMFTSLPTHKVFIRDTG